MTGELGEEQRLVTVALVGTIALVVVVVDRDAVEQFDLQGVRVGGGPHRGDDRLVDVTAEPDVGAVAPQPVLPQGRPADPGHEAHPTTHARGGAVEVGTGVVEVAAHLIVSVDVEDPVAGGEVEAAVARRREVAPPGFVRDDGPVLFGDRDGPVGGTGVDDDDLVDQSAKRRQAGVETVRFVSDDESG